MDPHFGLQVRSVDGQQLQGKDGLALRWCHLHGGNGNDGCGRNRVAACRRGRAGEGGVQVAAQLRAMGVALVSDVVRAWRGGREMRRGWPFPR